MVDFYNNSRMFITKQIKNNIKNKIFNIISTSIAAFFNKKFFFIISLVFTGIFKTLSNKIFIKVKNYSSVVNSSVMNSNISKS